jgi:FMNH2-dependent dimethyl sulfone monooxygenase
MKMEFSYWVPDHSSAQVITRFPRRTDWSWEYNRELAQTAEAAGFDYGLLPARWQPAYGQHDAFEAISLSGPLLAVTEKIRFIAAVHTGMWHPGIVAKMGTTLDHVSRGRWALNVISGWRQDEFDAFGFPWIDHDDRYKKSEEFIEVLRAFWTEEKLTYNGDFYQITNASSNPKPLTRPSPPIFQGGNSNAGREMAARLSDYYFMNGGSVEKIGEQIADVRRRAAKYGRTVKFALNAFAICRPTEQEAMADLRGVIEQMDVESVKELAELVKGAGRSTQDKVGMWSDSTLKDLVQVNEGFKPGLIGTPEQVATRIQEYESVGINLFQLGFLHCIDDVRHFGETVIPLVRQMPSLRSQESAIGS